MSVNSKHRNDFDAFVKEQVNHVQIEFNENHWKQLESELNLYQQSVPNSGYTLTYKGLFYITLGTLLTLVVAIFLYLNNQKAAVLAPVLHENQTETELVDEENNVLPNEQSQELLVVPVEESNSASEEHKQEQPVTTVSEDTLKETLDETELAPEKTDSKRSKDSTLLQHSKKKHIIW
jgi:hypothetical protein